jgi:predicted RNA-binding protein with PUA domain
MIRVYMMKRGKETLLKEYKTIKGVLDFMENEKNYDYILYAIKNKNVVAFQSFIQRKSFMEKMLDRLSEL